jgi:hypothetical protein
MESGQPGLENHKVPTIQTMKTKPNQLPPSRELELVLMFATKLAQDRKSRVGLRDLLAGMYLSALDRLRRYWNEWEQLEEFVVSECDLSQPRFLYLFEMSEYLRSDRGDTLTNFEDEVSAIINDANGLASASGWDETKLEHLLSAIATGNRSDLCQKFVSSGMNVDLVHRRMRKAH